MRISVLGLGRMGAPMARNLIEVGHDVTLYNRTHERAVELAVKGARAAGSVADAVREAQVALTMVADDEAEQALTFGMDGLLTHLPPGAIHLCMSTIGLETSRKLALAHAEAGQGYVAAPVFGRPGAAVSHHLWMIVGGPDTQVTRCLTIFETLGRGITRVGPRAELAHALKIGGDLLTGIMIEGLSEVLAYGEKAGLAPAEYLRLLNTAIFKSPMMDSCGGLIVRHVHDPADLTLDSALKDTRLAIQASEELDAVMPMAELLHQRLELAAVQGWGAQDLTVLSRSCRMAAALEGSEAREESEHWQKADHPSKFTAQSHEVEVELDLDKVTHFEVIKDSVWAWTQGKRYCTRWKHLAEVERVFRHVPFVRIHRHILLQPDAALAHKAISEGKPKASGEEKMEPSIPDLAEHLSTDPVSVEEKPVMPEPMETAPVERETAIVPVWSRGKRHLASFRDLIARSVGQISFPHRQLPIPVQLDAAQPIESIPADACEAVAEEKAEPPIPCREDHLGSYPAKDDEKPVMLTLTETSHFELEKGVVWAWSQGKRYRASWRSLTEIESTFSQVILLRIQRNILLHPEAVLSLKPVFGGRAKVTVGGDMELDVSRAAALRLKELLGM